MALAATAPEARAWRARAFAAVALACALFAVLTVAATLTYAGGTYSDPTSTGFSWFNNFFSDLGRTATRLGKPQPVTRFLFTTALLLVSMGLVSFFAAFAGLVPASSGAKRLAVVGSLLGAAAGLCFAGIALVPSDVDLSLHDRLVQWAFRCFLGAVLCYVVALPARGPLPPRFRRAFLGFALLLAAYVLLITFGPPAHEAAGQTIQATGQKIIVVAAVACVGVQSLWAWRWLVAGDGFRKGGASQQAT